MNTYIVKVTAGGTTATASKQCRTKREAESVREKLLALIKDPVEIVIGQAPTANKRGGL